MGKSVRCWGNPENVMRQFILLLLLTACNGALLADPADKPQDETHPQPDLGAAKAEKPVKMEKAVRQEDQWSQAQFGVIGQFIQAPSVLEPINPLAKAEAGFGEGNLSKDTVTGRIMGLRFIKFEF
jgi:hypothetical protein